MNSNNAIFLEPASHSYLGNDLRDVFLQSQHNYTNQENDPSTNSGRLLVFQIKDVVLFPGETIPLRFSEPAIIRIVKEIIAHYSVNSTTGMCNSIIPLLGITHSARKNAIGTAVEIRSWSEQIVQSNPPSSHDELVITAKGRRRFRIDHAYRCEQSRSTYFTNVCFLDESIKCLDYSNLSRQHLYGLPFPKWVYSAYSPKTLAQKASSLYAAMPFKPHQSAMEYSESSPEMDPVDVSFRICSSLPLQFQHLQQLLEANDVIDRLRLVISLMERESRKRLACAECGNPLASQSQIFNFRGAEGIAGAYVNPHGVVHQTITVRSLLDPADSVLIDESSPPSTADCWFPGYAWSVVHCDRCFNHLGWRYTPATANAMTESNGSDSGEDSEEEEEEDDNEGDEEEERGEDCEAMETNSNESFDAVGDRMLIVADGGEQSSRDFPVMFWGLRRAAVKPV